MCLTLSVAIDDRLIVGSDVGNGYPYTDLVYGISVLSIVYVFNPFRCSG
jgi:hypothetical protein